MTSSKTKTIYTCPMHPEIKQDQPGLCPKCGGMELEPQQVPLATPVQTGPVKVSFIATYTPLLIVVTLIAIVASAASLHHIFNQTFAWESFFRYSMAGFFIAFSLLKLIDIKGFAEGFSTYDLLAKKLPVYGFIYPYLELSLGLLYLLNIAPLATNIATVLVMGLASLGVAKALTSKRQIQCACLGTVLKVPLSKVTFIEDIAMVAMALIHIWLIAVAGHNTSTHSPATFVDTFSMTLVLTASLVFLIYIQSKQEHA